MRPSYLAGLVGDLVTRSGHPQVTGTQPWHGPSGDAHVAGVWVSLAGGAGLGVQVVASSPPTGGHSAGPEVYDPAAGPTGDVSGLGAAAPVGARAWLGYLTELLSTAGHEEIAAVEPSPTGRAVRIELSDNSRAFCMLAGAAGPGGRKLPDWDPSQWGQMA